MISPVSHTSLPQAVSNATPVNQKSPTAKSQSSTNIQDTVQLSSTAQAQLTGVKAIVQEATETAAQTAQEARGGDSQARRVLAQQALTAELTKGK